MHIFIKASALTKCPKCGKPALPHTVCFNCGYYKGIQVIDVLKKLTKKEQKAREKEIAGKETKDRGKIEKQPLTWEKLSKK